MLQALIMRKYLVIQAIHWASEQVGSIDIIDTFETLKKLV